jgi:hypothetical protein
MSDALPFEASINFGDITPAIDALLQRGVAAYRRDRSLADQLFREALAASPHELPVYLCLYKIHTYQGSLDEALRIAECGLQEAARQAGFAPHWRDWQPQAGMTEGPGRFALYTLKALAFIHLRRDERAEAEAILGALAHLDPQGHIGWSVIEDLAQGLK